MEDCVFCRIASKKTPAKLVKETDRLIVIKDIHPQAPTHLLILPKKHYSTVLDCKDRDLLGEMLEAASEVAKELGVDKSGFRTVINTNEEGGQTVFHLHMHFIAGRPLMGRMG
ncbi:MAG: histidine triad nucleotide-binding protein [Deltaproteobacteria bacterium]|nr:histidine triad nucleotide-binding protein [Deltaproteobacteria bacterium]